MDYTRLIPIPSPTCEIGSKEGDGLCGKTAEWVAINGDGVRMAVCGQCLSDILTDDLNTGEWAIGLDGITTTEGDC